VRDVEIGRSQPRRRRLPVLGCRSGRASACCARRIAVRPAPMHLLHLMPRPQRSGAHAQGVTGRTERAAQRAFLPLKLASCCERTFVSIQLSSSPRRSCCCALRYMQRAAGQLAALLAHVPLMPLGRPGRETRGCPLRSSCSICRFRCGCSPVSAQRCQTTARVATVSLGLFSLVSSMLQPSSRQRAVSVCS
jgi:hypothetical protein